MQQFSLRGIPLVVAAVDNRLRPRETVSMQHIVLDDMSVSRRHARLRFCDGHWILQDLQSTNGTLVNRAAVVRCQLHPGDEVHVGTVQLLVD